jgi:hypothetical protein
MSAVLQDGVQVGRSRSELTAVPPPAVAKVDCSVALTAVPL